MTCTLYILVRRRLYTGYMVIVYPNFPWLAVQVVTILVLLVFADSEEPLVTCNAGTWIHWV